MTTKNEESEDTETVLRNLADRLTCRVGVWTSYTPPVRRRSQYEGVHELILAVKGLLSKTYSAYTTNNANMSDDEYVEVVHTDLGATLQTFVNKLALLLILGYRAPTRSNAASQSGWTTYRDHTDLVQPLLITLMDEGESIDFCVRARATVLDLLEIVTHDNKLTPVIASVVRSCASGTSTVGAIDRSLKPIVSAIRCVSTKERRAAVALIWNELSVAFENVQDWWVNPDRYVSGSPLGVFINNTGPAAMQRHIEEVQLLIRTRCGTFSLEQVSLPDSVRPVSPTLVILQRRARDEERRKREADVHCPPLVLSRYHEAMYGGGGPPGTRVTWESDED